MAELSQDELEAIRSHPLEKGLNHFRTTFKTRYPKSESANLTEIVDRLISEAPDGGKKDGYEFRKVVNRRQERKM